MTNINCSASCLNEKNGKCALKHVSITASIIGHGSNCAYFSPRAEDSITPPKTHEIK